jgi:hypothetical protein
VSVRPVGLIAALSLLACGGAAPQKRRPVDPTVKMLDRLSENIQQMPPRAAWRVVNTASFRVLYLGDENLGAARAVASAAEATRTAQFQTWLPDEAPPRWAPRCDIYLYPSNRLMVQMSGGEPKAGSAAARASRLLRGRMLQRKMNLAADDPELLENTLPHEVSHVIVAELMGDRPLPLWANEGLAMLAETQRTRVIYAAIVRAHHRRGRLYPLKTLTAMVSYPDEKRLFYGQSLSLVRFLLTRGDRAQLLAMLLVGVSESSLRDYYGLGGFLGLQQAWLRWIEGGN